MKNILLSRIFIWICVFFFIALGFLVGLFPASDERPPDCEEAIKWFMKAAEQERVEAQYELGLKYESGCGAIKPNRDEARKWFQRAARNGSVLAGQRLDRLTQRPAGSTDGNQPKSAAQRLGRAGPKKDKICAYAGAIYEGDLNNDKPQGRGVMMWPNGAIYEGDFADGNLTGKGKLIWPNGGRYEGGFVDNKRAGKGVDVYPDGSRYEGDFVDDKPTGKGKLIWPNGGRYEGDFEIIKGPARVLRFGRTVTVMKVTL
ncbi:MAG: SEL1-like repeat protein [Deltaproteobacteria bacterium]|nr:SEL1-like repeat protein [Deltaproteobacteria bacterium]